MAKQIVRDTRQAVPGTGVTRAAANTGLLVTFAHIASPPQPVDYPIQAAITTAATAIIQGVFLDYKSAAGVEIGTKGVFRVLAESSVTPGGAHVGLGILPAAGGTATPTAKAADNIATGTIVGFDGQFLYVDLNLPN